MNSRHRRRIAAVLVPVTIGLLVAAGIGSAERDQAKRLATQPIPNPPGEVKHDTSPPLKSIPPKPHQGRKIHTELKPPVPPGGGTSEAVQQTRAPRLAAPALITNFAGVAVQDSAPPDTNGAAGAAHYVQIVNESFQAFSKTGASVYGPVPTNTIWTGFGGGCENNNDGDATVEYDRAANRWIIQQFSVSTSPYLECVAVSATSDPTGSWYRYAFGGFGNNFPDYPKLGVWPDAYYVTYNLFENAAYFAGPEVCAYPRAKMLLGQTATQKCFILPAAYGSLLPSDVDSPTPPPSGAPNYLLSFDTNSLKLWKFHVDWANLAASTITGPTTIPVAAFTPACDGGTCIPQSGTSQRLDSLGDRLMYRLAYRNFGDHESLVVNHSIKAGTSSAVRWYELRSPGSSPTVYQQGTYAPDTKHRFMGSVAMDRNGGIALGFAVSSSTTFPGIHYTGRLAGDPLGTMTLGEGVLFDGSGSQNGGLERWGDYSSMSIDPSDDCTFWYTNEYLPNNGSFNWRTRVGSFKLPGCAGGISNDFSMSASPSTITAAQGAGGSTTINTALVSGSAQTVGLAASGQPAGTTVSFDPTSVTTGGSSTMSVTTSGFTPVGTFPIKVTGTGSSAVHSTTVNLTVTSTSTSVVVNGGFEAGNFSGWNAGGGVKPAIVTNAKHGGADAAQLGSTTPRAGDSQLKQTVAVPTGSPQLSFWYLPHCKGTIAGDQIKMQIRSTGGAVLASVLKICTDSATWLNATVDLTPFAGQSIVLWFNNHDDGRPNEATYFVLDDVTVGAASQGGNVVKNAGFESGLDSWTPGGSVAPLLSSPTHSGTASVRLGSPNAYNGDSSISQAVIVPAGTPTLSFWYLPNCHDSISYDQIQMQVRKTNGQILATVLNTCDHGSVWKQRTFAMKNYAGQSVVLWFNVHDDGVPQDPNSALFDDVSLS